MKTISRVFFQFISGALVDTMMRRSRYRYPDVLLAATIEERNRLGIRESYYIAKNLKRGKDEFVKGDYSKREKVDAAFVVCDKIINDDYIMLILDTLLKAYYKSTLYQTNKACKIKIVFPMPCTNEQSTNELSPVFVALLENKMREVLRKTEPSHHLQSSVECEFNVRSLVKVERTVSLPERATLEENLLSFISPLAKQPLFDGVIDRDAIYLIADDSVRRQTTFANLATFIAANGGIIGAATALIGVPESTKMQAFPETLHFLLSILNRRALSVEKVNEVLNDPYLFGNLHLHIGSEKQNTLTNLEVLLLGSYFGNSKDKEEFENMLELAGCNRNAEGRISDYLKLSTLLKLERAPGTPEELRKLFVKILKQKELQL